MYEFLWFCGLNIFFFWFGFYANEAYFRALKEFKDLCAVWNLTGQTESPPTWEIRRKTCYSGMESLYTFINE